MNFMEVEVVRTNGTFVAQNEALKLNVPDDRGEKAAAQGGPVTLGIRPEAVSLAEDEETGITGEVYVVEPLGRDDLIDVRIGDDSILLLTDPRQDVREGQTVRLHFNTNKVQFFDRQTEQSLLWN